MCISYGCSNSRSCEYHSDDTMRLVLRNCLINIFTGLGMLPLAAVPGVACSY